jgi:hypothetical protein
VKPPGITRWPSANPRLNINSTGVAMRLPATPYYPTSDSSCLIAEARTAPQHVIGGLRPLLCHEVPHLSPVRVAPKEMPRSTFVRAPASVFRARYARASSAPALKRLHGQIGDWKSRSAPGVPARTGVWPS